MEWPKILSVICTSGLFAFIVFGRLCRRCGGELHFPAGEKVIKVEDFHQGNSKGRIFLDGRTGLLRRMGTPA